MTTPHTGRHASALLLELKAATTRGAVHRAKDSIARSPMVFPCHVDSVEGSTVSLRVCGVLKRDAGERLTIAVGSVAWLE